MSLLLAVTLLLSGASSSDASESEPLVAAVSASVVEPPLGVWDRLAACESTGRWHANTGNSYFGGLQMDSTFWKRHGGLEFAPRADLASRAQQIIVAERGLAIQGPGAWPICSYVAGLR